MSRYSQDVRDGLTATLKSRQERHDSHVRSRDASLRTPERLARLRASVDEAQAALDAHVAEHGPNGDGKPHPFGIFAHYAGQRHKIFILVAPTDGNVAHGLMRPLTIEDIAAHFSITQEPANNE